MRSTAHFSAETEKFMPEVSRVIENSKKKKLPTENTVSGKLFFKNKGELNIFPISKAEEAHHYQTPYHKC